MQRLQVRARHLEVRDARVTRELSIEQPRRVLHKLDVRPVELGERLLVLALHHHLRLGLERVGAVALQVLDPERASRRELDAHPRLRSLRVRRRKNTACIPGVLGQLRAARTRRRVDKIKLHDAAEFSRAVHRRLISHAVVLPAGKSAAEARLDHRVGERQFDPRVEGHDRALILRQQAAQHIKREHLVLVVIE